MAQFKFVSALHYTRHPIAARPCELRTVPEAVHQPGELEQLHAPAVVRVICEEDPCRLAAAHVQPQRTQASTQLAVVEAAAAVIVEPVEDRLDRRVDIHHPVAAVRPQPSRAEAGAPALSRRMHTLRWPAKAATCNGVIRSG